MLFFFLLVNVKMPTIVGILTFIGRKISCSPELSTKKTFITLVQRVYFFMLSDCLCWLHLLHCQIVIKPVKQIRGVFG